jgi:hypothetical protein
MQSTAMSETVSLCAFVAALFYALRLSTSHHASDIVKCAAAVAAGTLVRYDDWIIAIALIPVLIVIAWKHGGYPLAEAWVILYGLLAFAGCVAWVLYNAVIFHDPLLSFFYGQSNHKYFANAPARMLPGRGHPLVAFKMYGLSVAGTVGWPLIAVAGAGLVVAVWRLRLGTSSFPVYLSLLPFVFYVSVFYLGVNTANLPQLGMGSYYNIRFGLAMVPSVAVLSGFFVSAWTGRLGIGVAASLLLPVAAWGVWGSLAATPFVEREAMYGPAGLPVSVEQQASWLAMNYHGGNILLSYSYSSGVAFLLMTAHGFSDRAFITDANGRQFAEALRSPEESVSWVVLSLNADDGANPVRTALLRDSTWRSYFVLRNTFGATQVYERLDKVSWRGQASYQLGP